MIVDTSYCKQGFCLYIHTSLVSYYISPGNYYIQPLIYVTEPILSEGTDEVYILSDGWTAVTYDGSRTAQFEHTILVTKDGAEILTK